MTRIFTTFIMTLGLTLHAHAQVGGQAEAQASVAHSDERVKTADSIFVKQSRPIPFVVNKILISQKDRQWITDSLIPKLNALGNNGIIIGRATASPEGNTENNTLLAYHRKEAVNSLLANYGIDTDRIYYDVVAEDYPLLLTLMEMKHDKYLPSVKKLMKQYGPSGNRLKEAMARYNGGRLWQHILHQYFPQLRAVRIMAIHKDKVDGSKMEHTQKTPIQEKLTADTINDSIPEKEWIDSITTESKVEENKMATEVIPPIIEEVAAPNKQPRRELLSLKTNLLFDFAYMPGYDRFCPIPNVAIEYYPLHGHMTYGASFDGPWWQHYNDHKYFQLRNYQLHTRYYLKRGDIEQHQPGKGAAFKGLFFSAYAHAYIYNICFSETKGWEGEGLGGGLGIGYVLPLDKKEHWRLEFAMQVGYLWSKYDPYQWRCPVDADQDQQLYYYKWYGEAKDFKKRQHHLSWFSPTRVEITLSYDILYRHRKK